MDRRQPLIDPIAPRGRGVPAIELVGLRPRLVRAFNVLRWYDESQVPAASGRMLGRRRPAGAVRFTASGGAEPWNCCPTTASRRYRIGRNHRDNILTVHWDQVAPTT